MQLTASATFVWKMRAKINVMDFNTKIFFTTTNIKHKLLIEKSVMMIGILRLYFCVWSNCGL